MANGFRVLTTATFERNARKMLRKHPHLAKVIDEIAGVLREDPYNITRQHDIKKLHQVKPGEGQWRIRSGDYRLRYDIIEHAVFLHSIRHRKEAY